MGGHHHVTPPPVPDYKIYKVEDSEFLTGIQNRLAKEGLKDPWLRNHVWRCHLNKDIKRPNWFFLNLLTYGWKLWVPLVIGTIAMEKFLGIDYHAHGHGHDDEHGHDEHKEH